MAEIDLSENNVLPLVVATIIFQILTWIIVGLRTYVRVFMTRTFQLDDFLMLIAQSTFTLFCAFIFRGAAIGLGSHNISLPRDREIEALMYQALSAATYVLNMMFIKLSIGIFLLRLAVRPVYRYILWISLVVIGIWSLVIFLWDVFQCSPVAAQWDDTIPNHRCASGDQIVAAAYAISIMTITTDWLYALLPIPMLWGVKMLPQAKATVIFILGLGIFASIATLVRLKFLTDLENTDDLLFAGTDLTIWTAIEPGVAIIASSLATIRPLLKAMRLKGFDTASPDSAVSRAEKRCSQRIRDSHAFGETDLELGATAGGGDLERHQSRDPDSDGYSKYQGVRRWSRVDSWPLPATGPTSRPLPNLRGDGSYTNLSSPKSKGSMATHDRHRTSGA